MKISRRHNSFVKVRKFVHSLNLKSQNEWYAYCKSGKKPENIPSTPNRIYKDEWVSWGDFLGTNYIQQQKRNYLSYNDARKIIKKLEIKSQRDYRKFSNKNKIPKNIPAGPDKVYKKNGTWISWGDFLGTKNIATQNLQYRPFEDAKKFVRNLKFQNRSEWYAYCKSGKKPENIPLNLDKTYKNSGWTNWGDFLGTGFVSTTERSKKFLPIKDAKILARKIVKQYGIKNYSEWQKLSKMGKLPSNLPVNLQQTYDITSRNNKKNRQNEKRKNPSKFTKISS